MQYLNSAYTARYNARHKLRGHLFQGRYKALLVDPEAEGYFLTVSDYIHLNPVRAKLAGDLVALLKDPWSSAGWLAGMRRKRPSWLRWERVYGQLGLKDHGGRSRREFRRYLEQRMVEVRGENPEADRERWKGIRRGWCLGAGPFVARMKERLEEMMEAMPRERDSWSGEAMEAMEEELAERALTEGCRRLGYGTVERVRRMDRYLLARWVRSRTKARLKWVARRFGMRSAGTLSHGIWRVGERMGKDRSLKERWNWLEG